jgi:selenocysteine lyase/cysteine desulfurase
VLAAKHQLEEQCEFNTEKWFRRDAEKLLNDTRAFVAGRVNCPLGNVFMVQNATDAINCLAKSLLWSPGDVVLLSNLAYASIRKTIYVLRERYGVTILEVLLRRGSWSSGGKTCSRRKACSCAWRTS